jgi:hypothetical protein
VPRKPYQTSEKDGRGTRTPLHSGGMDGSQRSRACVWLRLIAAALAIQSVSVRARAAEPDAFTPESWEIQQSAQCSSAIHEAEQQHQLPSGLLASIARVESGRPVTTMNDVRPWPWTIDADGNGLFLDSKAAAVAWVAQQTSHHRYIDVGCLQVDLTLHPHAFASLDQAFDPVANADYAARYLSALYRDEAGHNWDIAVGLYHSHTASLAADYRDRIAMVGVRILHGVLEPVPLYVRAIRQGTLRLPLGAGKSTPINVNRQPAARSHRRLSTCQIERVLGPYLNASGSNNRCTQTARSSGP